MQERPDSKTLAPLTSVRLFAASGILFFHIWPTFFDTSAAPGWPLGQSISLFFVLSGFILYYVYPTLEAPGSARRFLVARIARLWPVHMLALGLLLLMVTPRGVHGTVIDLAANLLLVHAWIPNYPMNTAFNSVSWTLSTEMGFYVLFPLMVRDFARSWWWKLAGTALLTVGILTSANVLGLQQSKDGGISAISLAYTHPLTRLFEFTLGMTAALFWRRITRKWTPSTWMATAMEMAALALVFAGAYSSLAIANYFNNNVGEIFGQWMYRTGPTCFAFAALLLVLAMRRGLVSKALSWSPLVLLGQVSFAVYMTHQVLQRGLLRYYPAPSEWGYPPALLLILFVVATVAISYAIFRWFETPLRYWLVRLYDRVMARRRDEITGNRKMQTM